MKSANMDNHLAPSIRILLVQRGHLHLKWQINNLEDKLRPGWKMKLRMEDQRPVEVQSFGQPLLALVQPGVLFRPSDFQGVYYYPRTWHSSLVWWKGENLRDGILGPNTGFPSDLLSNPVTVIFMSFIILRCKIKINNLHLTSFL